MFPFPCRLHHHLHLQHLDSQDTVLFVESRMNEERTLTTMLQTNLMSEEE